MGLLEKYRKQSWLAKTFDDLEAELAKGIRTAEMPPWFLIRTYCLDCDESCLAIKHEGKRHLVIDVDNHLRLHQCPHPFDIGVEEGHPEPTEEEEIDWSERQDIEEELKKNQWADSYSYPDDPYNYPDIPYVDPTGSSK